MMRKILVFLLLTIPVLSAFAGSPAWINGPWRGDKPLGHVISLNGRWQVEEGTLDEKPAHFGHTVPVPGIVKNADPAFAEVGLSSDLRQAYWYRTTFTLPPGYEFQIARLLIRKSRYGATVYINGVNAGSNMLNLTAGEFDITPYLCHDAENELVVRLGAHIDQAPDTVCTAGEVEKEHYYAGLYDDVRIILEQAPYISNIQVAPDLDNESVLVAVEWTNPLDKSETARFNGAAYDYEDKSRVNKSEMQQLELGPHTTQTVTLMLQMPHAKRWTPESPHLYVLEIKRGDECAYTRFGMRTFRVDNRYINRALLNGQQYFLRGTNVSLFRFFEDSLCHQQPWDREWVRKLHQRFKSLHWNSYRISVSALPEFWYDIADEMGFVVFDEFPMWYALQNDMASEKDKQRNLADPVRRYGVYPHKLTADHLVNEYTRWMRGHWNHASVCAWDAQNETWTPATGQAINRVRELDLSNRPWDNGWSPPAGPDDYREAHNYLAAYNVGNEQGSPRATVPEPFKLADLPEKDRIGFTFYLPYQAHYENGHYNEYWDTPCVLNEYAYLWLNRDGSPTTLTRPYYDAVLGSDATPDQRFEHYAYMLAALTEFWRSSRTFFGVLHVFGLSFSADYAATGDIFTDVDSLLFYPYFKEHAGNAFAPTGICIDYWQDEIKAHRAEWPPISGFEVPVIITNDVNQDLEGNFVLRLSNTDTDSLYHDKPCHFEVNAVGQSRRLVKIQVPRQTGHYILSAEMHIDGQGPVTSYRKIRVVE